MLMPLHGTVVPAPRLCVALTLLAVPLGCAGTSAPAPTRGLDRSERVVRAAAPSDGSERPPAVVNGEAIAWGELRPILSEAAGAEAIQEVALDRLLEAAMVREGVRISEADVERERRLLIDRVANRGASGRVLEEIRQLRGLGDVRFARTLERNARLRALVAPGIEISEDEIRRAHEIDHGEKVQVRLIVTPTEQAARRARSAIGQEPGVRARFIELASAQSTDASSRVGGLIEPISLADPAYSAGLRGALRQTRTGDVTPVVALDEGGFAIAYVERVTPASGRSLGAVRTELERDLRLRAERLAMDRLARTMLGGATITVFDRGLDWSWRTRNAERQAR